VEHAANGNQAVARTTRETVVVLFDLVMPETHGFHYLRNIRKSFSSTKIIAITRKRHTQDAVLCRKLGVYDSLTKPLDPNDVVEIVARAVRDEPVVSVDFALSAGAAPSAADSHHLTLRISYDPKLGILAT
jgi:DNA-binding response OmpR family regulator